MSGEFLVSGRVRTRLSKGSVLSDEDYCFGYDLGDLGNKLEPDLAAAAKLDIDLGEQLRVEQGTVQAARGIVDAEALAQRTCFYDRRGLRHHSGLGISENRTRPAAISGLRA